MDATTTINTWREIFDQIELFEKTGDASLLAAIPLWFFIAVGVVALVLYVYQSIAVYRIASKLNTPYPWLAWIPLANLFLMFRMAERPYWWMLPVVFTGLADHADNVLAAVGVIGSVVFALVFIDVWGRICRRLGQNRWLGILMVIPVGNLILMGYLAFSSKVRPASEEARLEPIAGA